jgi:hypothetical protein
MSPVGKQTPTDRTLLWQKLLVYIDDFFMFSPNMPKAIIVSLLMIAVMTHCMLPQQLSFPLRQDLNVTLLVHDGFASK